MAAILDRDMRETASRWLSESDELLVTSFFSAGDQDYWFCRSVDDIEAFCKRSGHPWPASVCIFRGRRLPLRGVVTYEFIETALASVADHTNTLVLVLKPRRPGLLTGNLCDDHEDLAAELGDVLGEDAAVGELPWWPSPDKRAPDEKGWTEATIRTPQ